MATGLATQPVMERSKLAEHFLRVRQTSERLCRPLTAEDTVMQTIEDVSPPKWHLGHTTWFFERVVLQEYEKGFSPINERYYFVFNSYYQAFGERLQRNKRGTLCRPTLDEVMAYRQEVTERTVALIKNCGEDLLEKISPLILVGCNHEQQHQELFVTDIKNIYASNPFEPAYHKAAFSSEARPPELEFIPFEGGVVEIGASGDCFAYDNEFPRHKEHVYPFALANRPVTNAEFLAFMDDGGYQNHRWWLSDGWDRVESEGWQAPLYWRKREGEWYSYTLSGARPVDPDEPVCHVSYYEAAAYARWARKRLPTEAEWELAAEKGPYTRGNLLDDETFHPILRKLESERSVLHHMVGDVWEWTGSAYLPYPGYQQTYDALGEYNGKFMSSQMVLRGGSCATPGDHIRLTYRNFFQPEKRWQFMGFRLADNA